MTLEIVPAYDRKEEIKELFKIIFPGTGHV